MLKTILKIIVNFIKEHKQLIEIILEIARQLFGNDIVNLCIAEVKNAQIKTTQDIETLKQRYMTGREKFEYVKGQLLLSIEYANSKLKDEKFWINLLVEIVVAYYKIRIK